jgi:DNA mismatch endonuclease (patch repair protein)
MADVFTKDRRSYVMSRIRSHRNLGTELSLIVVFKKAGIVGWRRRYTLFGNPDFVFPKAKIAVFVDGVFWHSHPRLGHIPKSNQSYWINKLERNKRRDRLVNRTLRSRGWSVVRIWQHEIHGTSGIRKLERAGLLPVKQRHPSN